MYINFVCLLFSMFLQDNPFSVGCYFDCLVIFWVFSLIVAVTTLTFYVCLKITAKCKLFKLEMKLYI